MDICNFNIEYEIIEIYTNVYETREGKYSNVTSNSIAISKAYKYENNKYIEFQFQNYKDKLIEHNITDNLFDNTKVMVITILILITGILLLIWLMKPNKIM